MKKLVFAVLAIGAMAACTKVSVQHEQTGEISFQPVAAMATKAAVDGPEYPEDLNFRVWAWWGGAEASDTPAYAAYSTVYINQGEFQNKSDGNWGGWDSSQGKAQPYYWPTTGSLVFAGFSPANATGTFGYDLQKKTFTATNYVQSNDISKTHDLMWFDAGESYASNLGTKEAPVGIPAVFHHALSWLTFRFNLKDATTSQNWKITGVTLKNIETKADYTHPVTSPATPWINQTDRKDMVVWTGEHNVVYKSTEPDKLESVENGVVIIPQSSIAGSDEQSDQAPMLVITYNLKSPAGPILENQQVTLPLTTTNGTAGDPTDDNNWLPGKHYTYTIIFGANEILISPTVASWTDVTETVNVENH